jgi:energy-coupling factor transporter ATP-binding protein EcfA2
MATDLETGTEPGDSATARPRLKIVGLHIKGLKSIGSLDLPEDGLGWDGAIPDFVMVGGINGSGKTTLLEFLVGAFGQLVNVRADGFKVEIPTNLQAEEAILDFRCELPDFGEEPIRFLVGKKEFVKDHYKKNCFGFEYANPSRATGRLVEDPLLSSGSSSHQLKHLISNLSERNSGEIPSVVYFPSEGRTLINPDTQFKFTGNVENDFQFVYIWQPPKALEKADRLVERIYNIRWQDLNAKEQGRISESKGFDAYSRAFDRFFEGRKRLRWTPKGELVVETKSGDSHNLSELSSGEKQAILFMGELLHRWRPGSIILIDEPELHLHESYQTKLWQALVDWQQERGGQVILTTQSGHLFGISEPGIKVLLGGESLR